MPSPWLGSNKYQSKSHLHDSPKVQTDEVRIPRSSKTGDGRSTHLAILSGHVYLGMCVGIYVYMYINSSIKGQGMLYSKLLHTLVDPMQSEGGGKSSMIPFTQTRLHSDLLQTLVLPVHQKVS